MKIILGGVRGSCPVAQPEFMKYGGETSSFLIEGEAGERILIDGGTGVRLLGRRLPKTPGISSAWLFMTHFHLDHVVGLSMLPVLHNPNWRLTMAAPDHHPIHIREMMARLLDVPLWPLQVEDLKSKIDFVQLDGITASTPYRCGSIEVRWCPVHHPGGCTAYRFDEPSTGASLVVATDMEWGLSTPGEKGYLERLISYPSPAGLLLMDGQYDDGQIAKYRGWGHSSWQECVALASRLRVRQLLITHHDPASDDVRLDVYQHAIRRAAPWAGLAHAGMEITLPAETCAQQ